MQELRKVIGEVRYNLAFHAPIIYTPMGRTPERSSNARDALMKSSCDLLAKLQAVFSYDTLASMFRKALPPRQSIERAAKELRGLSTHMHETGEKANDALETISLRVERIEKLLRLKPLE